MCSCLMCRFLHVLCEFQSKRGRCALPSSLRWLCIRTAPIWVLNAQCTFSERGTPLSLKGGGDIMYVYMWCCLFCICQFEVIFLTQMLQLVAPAGDPKAQIIRTSHFCVKYKNLLAPQASPKENSNIWMTNKQNHGDASHFWRKVQTLFGAAGHTDGKF